MWSCPGAATKGMRAGTRGHVHLLAPTLYPVSRTSPEPSSLGAETRQKGSGGDKPPWLGSRRVGGSAAIMNGFKSYSSRGRPNHKQIQCGDRRAETNRE